MICIIIHRPWSVADHDFADDPIGVDEVDCDVLEISACFIVYLYHIYFFYVK